MVLGYHAKLVLQGVGADTVVDVDLAVGLVFVSILWKNKKNGFALANSIPLSILANF